MSTVQRMVDFPLISASLYHDSCTMNIHPSCEFVLSRTKANFEPGTTMACERLVALLVHLTFIIYHSELISLNVRAFVACSAFLPSITKNESNDRLTALLYITDTPNGPFRPIFRRDQRSFDAADPISSQHNFIYCISCIAVPLVDPDYTRCFSQSVCATHGYQCNKSDIDMERRAS